jgi:phosphoglycolate phosphatase-like HAD superfamily hydrolase
MYNKMPIKTIIFDWSGVLSHDIQCVVDADNAFLKEEGKEPITLKWFRENYTTDFESFWRKLGITYPMEYIQKRYEHHFKGRMPSPIPGGKEILEKLALLKKELIVISAHPQHFLEEEVKRYGFAGLFKHVFGYATNKEAKIKELNPNPNSTVFLGDTIHDVIAGKNAGVIPVGIHSKYGYNSRDKLDMHTKYVVESLPEFLELVKSL